MDRMGYSAGSIGGTGRQLLAVPAGISGVQFGKYHNMNCSTAPWTIYPQQTKFQFADYPWGDPDNPDDYATVECEPQSLSRAEMCAAMFNLSNIYEGGRVSFSWYRDRDKLNFLTIRFDVPDPNEYGYEYWEWFSVACWTGKFPIEISEPGHYFVVIESPWGNRTVDFDVLAPAPICDFGVD